MSEDDLVFLLKQARARNESQNVTGMLLYAEKRFLQVLEGDQTDVDDIYESILNDGRNTGNVVYVKKEISEREFPNWAMGFRHLKKQDREDLEGFTEFLDSALDLRKYKQSHAVLLLSQFKDLT